MQSTEINGTTSEANLPEAMAQGLTFVGRRTSSYRPLVFNGACGPVSKPLALVAGCG